MTDHQPPDVKRDARSRRLPWPDTLVCSVLVLGFIFVLLNAAPDLPIWVGALASAAVALAVVSLAKIRARQVDARRHAAGPGRH